MRALSDMSRSLLALCISVLITGIMYWSTGQSFGGVVSATWDGAAGNLQSVEITLGLAIPLILLCIGLLFSFRAGLFNIGGQGQFYAGGVAAAAVAISWPATDSAVLGTGLALLSGAVGGGMWSLIAGLLKILCNADEVLTTLLLNFIASLLLAYVEVGPLRASSGAGDSALSQPIPGALRVSDSTGLSLTTIVLTAVLAIAAWLVVNRTGFGVQCELLGRNRLMARWVGVQDRPVMLAVFAITGMTAGLAGALTVMGPVGALSGSFSPSIGFTALVVVTVASLAVGRSVIFGIIFGGLASAALFLPIVLNGPSAVVDVFQGLVALLITADLGGSRVTRMVRRARHIGGRTARSGPARAELMTDAVAK